MAFLVRLQGRTPREGVMAGHKKFSEKPRGELSSGICKADPKRVGFKIWDSHSQCSVQMLLGCENSLPRTIIVLLYLVCARVRRKNYKHLGWAHYPRGLCGEFSLQSSVAVRF